VRILNIGVEQVGIASDGRVIGRGEDVVSGWSIAFVVPPGQRDRVLADVRAGRRPVLPVPEFEALPWSSASGIEWE
jgi:hypothetical protein